MEFLLGFVGGLFSMIVAYSVFGKPKDYYQNRAEALENEIDNREVFEESMEREIEQLRAEIARLKNTKEHLTSEELLRKMR